MKWQWILTFAAEKQFDRFDPELRDRITGRLDDLAENVRDPVSGSCKELRAFACGLRTVG